MLTELHAYGAADTAYGRAEALRSDDADLLLCWGHSRKAAGDLPAAFNLYSRSASIDGNTDALNEMAAIGRALEVRPSIRPVAVSHSRPSDRVRPLAAPNIADERRYSATGIPDPAWKTRIDVVKRLAWAGTGELAIIVAHSPSGMLKPHLLPYLSALNAQGIASLLIVAADKQIHLDRTVIEAASGIYVRANAGFDFAAWAHAMYLHPEVFGASTLFLLNDSVLPATESETFATLFKQIRHSDADLVGLTESREYGWHIQSYFLALKQSLLASQRLQDFWASVRTFGDKNAVIQAYEIQLAREVECDGLSASVLFPSSGARNPTLYAWRQLLKTGFPFVKLSLLRGDYPEADTAELRSMLVERSFDASLIDTLSHEDNEIPAGLVDAIAAARQRVPHRLTLQGARVAYYGPWNVDSRAGAASRRMVDLLAGLPIVLNRHPLEQSVDGCRLIGPAASVLDFDGVADIAFIQLDPDQWSILSEQQRTDIAAATHRIGRWTSHRLEQAGSLGLDALCLAAPSDADSVNSDEALVHVVRTPVDLPVHLAADRAKTLRRLNLPPHVRIILTIADEPQDPERMDVAVLIRAFRLSGLVSQGWILLVDAPAVAHDSAMQRTLLGGSKSALGVRILDRRLAGNERGDVWDAVDIYASADTSTASDDILIEAMAAGRTVVAPINARLSDLFNEQTGVPVADASPDMTSGVRYVDELALIEGLKTATLKNDTLGAAAQERARTLFSSDSAAGQIADALLATLLSNPPRLYPNPEIEPQSRGVPIETAVLPDSMMLILLSQDGSPVTKDIDEKRIDRFTDSWYLIAPKGTLLAPDLASTFEQYRIAHPGSDLFYADDVSVNCKEPNDRIRLKPHFDRILLAAQDYIGWPVFVRSDVFHMLGGLHPMMRTATTTELLFRADRAGLSIRRIPRVLLAFPGSRVIPDLDHYRVVVETQAHFDGMITSPGIQPNSLALTRSWPDSALPAVTILIATCRAKANDERPYVARLLEAICAADWPMSKLTVIIGDDQGSDATWARQEWPFVLHYVDTRRPDNKPFNYAAKMNALVRLAQTEQVVFLNDDVQPLDPFWLRALQDFAVRQDVGGVGARLLFPDGSLQHAGIIPHLSGTAHAWAHRRRAEGTYQDWALVHRQWSMVTGAVFATRQSVLNRVGGFDETFALEFNDSDLCLRLRAAGLSIVYTPHAVFEHAEKASRKNVAPSGADRARFRKRWAGWLADDPSWNPSLRSDVIDLIPSTRLDDWFLTEIQ